MINKLWMTSLAAFVAVAIAGQVQAELTATYVDSSNGAANNAGLVPAGRVEGDMTGVGEVSLYDIKGGDMWNGGDQFQYLHESNKITGSFTATARVVSQSEAIDGRWGKAGIAATPALDGLSRMAMAQLAAGNGSQVAAPAAGDHSPVPARLAGRTNNDGEGGFENAVVGAEGTGQTLDGDGNIANDTFRTEGTVPTWLRLSYDATTSEFVSSTALDVDGVPGVWSSSAPTALDASADGWYVGLAYSVHNDMVPVAADNMHGVTFDNVSIPEPTSLTLLGLGLLGLVDLLRRRRR